MPNSPFAKKARLIMRAFFVSIGEPHPENNSSKQMLAEILHRFDLHIHKVAENRRYAILCEWIQRGKGTKEDWQLLVDNQKLVYKRQMTAHLEHVNRRNDEKVPIPKQISPGRYFSGNTFGLRRDFYQTQEWIGLRYKALTVYGNRCMCCGRSPSDGVALHVDHIKPRSVFPERALLLENLQILCADCNRAKSNGDQSNWSLQSERKTVFFSSEADQNQKGRE